MHRVQECALCTTGDGKAFCVWVLAYLQLRYYPRAASKAGQPGGEALGRFRIVRFEELFVLMLSTLSFVLYMFPVLKFFVHSGILGFRVFSDFLFVIMAPFSRKCGKMMYNNETVHPPVAEKRLVFSVFDCLFEKRYVLKTLQIRNCIYCRYSACASFVFWGATYCLGLSWPSLILVSGKTNLNCLRLKCPKRWTMPSFEQPGSPLHGCRWLDINAYFACLYVCLSLQIVISNRAEHYNAQKRNCRLAVFGHVEILPNTQLLDSRRYFK